MAGELRCFLRSGLFCLLSLSPALCGEAQAEPVDRSLVLEEFDIPDDGDAILVPVTVDGKQCRFMLDTGCQQTVFDTPFRPLLELSLGTKRVATANGSTVVERFAFAPPHLKLGLVPIETNGAVACFSLDAIRKVFGEQIDGILGMDVLSQLVVDLNFDHAKLMILKSAGAPQAKAIAFRNARTPIFPVHFPGLDCAPFLIDTGHIAPHSGSLRAATFTQLEANGRVTLLDETAFADASGTVAMRRGSVSACAIDGVDFAKTIWSEHTSKAPNYVSLYFLTQFNITFDFPNRRMYFTRSRHFGHADGGIGFCGLRVVRIDGRTVIEWVETGSSADKCGLRAGDVISSIDGADAAQTRLFLVRTALSRPGEFVTLLLERDSATFERTLLITNRTIAGMPQSLMP